MGVGAGVGVWDWEWESKLNGKVQKWEGPAHNALSKVSISNPSKF